MYTIPTKTRQASALKTHLPERVMNLLENNLEPEASDQAVLLDTASPINLHSVFDGEAEYRAPRSLVVNLKRINDIRYINKFMEAVNERLPQGGHFLGCVEPTAMRYERLNRKFIRPFNYLYIALDYLLKRVWPKLPGLKKLYFLLTNGRNRVISEMETYGRLYSCGFTLVDSIESDGKLYFLGRKVKEPAFDYGASYGPFIRLRRCGKNGRSIRVHKFRTMYPYSEYIQCLVYEKYGLQDGGKMREDPRVNKMGAFLRKYWLDELPMLINLLRGDLKIFGVRPLSPHYLSLYPEDFQAYRNRFKPGLVPPFYVDLPVTTDEIVASEYRYLKAYEKHPLRTDLIYLYRAAYNILVKGARSS